MKVIVRKLLPVFLLLSSYCSNLNNNYRSYNYQLAHRYLNRPNYTRIAYSQYANSKKQNYYTPKVRDKKRPFAQYIEPENFYIAESKTDESIYMEDVIFKDITTKGKKQIYNGSKLFFKNPFTDQFFPEDNKSMMTSIGICRAKLIEVKKDLQDDGILNSSNKDSMCERMFGGRICNKKEMTFKQKSFQDLEDWHGDDFKDAMSAFLSSCNLFVTKSGIVKSEYITIASYREMKPLCEIAKAYHQKGYDKIFFERYFSPFLIHDENKDSAKGLFTGYYLWEIKASKFPSSKYWYPIYRKPSTSQDMKKTRKEINEGALRGKNLEILWCDNVYDVYSLQVQGSGIAFIEGQQKPTRLGFDGKNDFKFKSYSEKVKAEPEFFSNYCKQYEDIIDCLKKNSQIGIYATNHNDSFVFFKELEGEEIFGSQGVPLTQSRSIAIDPKYHPYGIPYYIETNLPLLEGENWLDFNRLWISQDTGSAIKGISRADLYMGHGFKGEYVAKNMKFKGSMYMLIPNFAIERIFNSDCGVKIRS